MLVIYGRKSPSVSQISVGKLRIYQGSLKVTLTNQIKGFKHLRKKSYIVKSDLSQMEINLLLHILTILSPEKTFTINMTTAPSILGHMMSGTDVTRPCELQLQCTVLIVINYSDWNSDSSFFFVKLSFISYKNTIVPHDLRGNWKSFYPMAESRASRCCLIHGCLFGY